MTIEELGFMQQLLDMMGNAGQGAFWLILLYFTKGLMLAGMVLSTVLWIVHKFTTFHRDVEVDTTRLKELRRVLELQEEYESQVSSRDFKDMVARTVRLREIGMATLLAEVELKLAEAEAHRENHARATQNLRDAQQAAAYSQRNALQNANGRSPFDNNGL